MVLQCSKLFYYKASGEFLRQDSQSSCSFGKIQNLGETKLSEQTIYIYAHDKNNKNLFDRKDNKRKTEKTCSTKKPFHSKF